MMHSRILAAALACGLLAGCASAGATAKGGKTLYQRVGGMPAIKALVIGTKDRVVKDSRVNEYFKGFDLEPIVNHFIQLACAATGVVVAMNEEQTVFLSYLFPASSTPRTFRASESGE